MPAKYATRVDDDSDDGIELGSQGSLCYSAVVGLPRCSVDPECLKYAAQTKV
jgi:hypothetical protein